MDLVSEIKNKISKKEIYRIVFYGPSTTNMQHVFPNWPEIIRYSLREHLEKITGDWKYPGWYMQTSNRALDGASSRELLDNCEEFVLKEKPDLVIIGISKNDAYLNIDPEESKRNTENIINNLLNINSSVVLITSVPSSDTRINNKIKPFVEIDRSIAGFYQKETKFSFIDFFRLISDELRKKMYSFASEGDEGLGFKAGDIDTIHFNQYGNAIVAGVILKECFGANFNADEFLADIKDETRKYPRF